MKGFLGSKDLKFRKPDETLAAALQWVQGDVDTRNAQLAEIMKALSLSRMDEWHLDQVLHTKLVQKCPEATKLIEEVIIKTKNVY